MFLRDSRTWNNRESKSRIKVGPFVLSLIPSFLAPPPTPQPKKKKFSYNQNIWKKLFKFNGIVIERNSPSNWVNKLSAKWWNWTKIKAWLMARNCWIYFSEESRNAIPNDYSHFWIIPLVSLQCLYVLVSPLLPLIWPF